MSSLCVQAGTLEQMCTADLGSMSQGTGHRCTCSLLSTKGQSNFRDGCNLPQFVSEREWDEDYYKKFMNVCKACIFVPSYTAFLFNFVVAPIFPFLQIVILATRSSVLVARVHFQWSEQVYRRKHVQPDRCQERQKVRSDVSLHRLCRTGGQNEEQTESEETDNYGQKGRTETNLHAEKCNHERKNMWDKERGMKHGGCVCGGGGGAGYSWQRDSQSQLPV